MAYYMTYGDFQAHMKSYYERTGRKLQLPEMTEYLYRKGLLLENIVFPERSDDYGNMSDEEFNRVVDSIPLNLSPYILNARIPPSAVESGALLHTRDVFVIRHPRYTRSQLHSHNYFELDFVIQGQGRFIFEDEERTMGVGELCIVAPFSRHDFLIDDESTVFTICIRQSTFDTTFFSLTSPKDLLPCFFRTILLDHKHPNYLMFFTKDNRLLKNYIRSMTIESNRMDTYGNTCCISYINLFFAEMLRSYSQTLRFYNYQMGTDFSLVLQYIQHNYRTLTLSSLAELFHYSEPHLCTLIRQNTGFTFTELIKKLRLADATNYLLNTDLKISEIAEQIGYNSADHFSRVFRSAFHISPQEYRKQHRNISSAFIPFAPLAAKPDAPQ